MPIIKDGKPVAKHGFLRKRQEREKAKKAGNYQVIRKDKTSADYDAIEVYVHGKKVELSDTSKYLIDMLIQQELD